MKDLNNSKKQVDDLKKIDIVIDENLEKYFRKFFIKNTKSNFKILRFYIYQYLNIFNYFRFVLRKNRILEDKGF